MQIESITITDEEVVQAVKEFLYNRFDLNIKVRRVHKKYSYQSEWNVEIEDPKAKVDEELTPLPKIPTVAEALGKDSLMTAPNPFLSA